ncbi:MAG: hypothetical protein ACP5N3_02060 [Candidatus Nanoarchaeia archaeon]
MDFQSLLEPTHTVSVNKTLIRVLTHVFYANEDVLTQKKIQTALSLDKKDVSHAIDEWEHLGWLQRDDLKICKHIHINQYKKTEIEAFIRSWQLFQHSILLRVHHMILSGQTHERATGAKNRLDSTIKPRTKNHGKEIIIDMPYGKIILYDGKTTIRYELLGYVLPVKKDDVNNLTEYLEASISFRIDKMLDILKSQKNIASLEINKITVFSDDIHIGIVTKRDIAKLIGICGALEKIGLHVDKSIQGCDEWEVHGTLSYTSEKIKEAVTKFLEKNTIEK